MSDVLATVTPIRPVSCFVCTHAVVTTTTFCSLFREPIDQEAEVAQDCDAYQHDTAKR